MTAMTTMRRYLSHACQAVLLLGLWLGLGRPAHAQADTVYVYYTDPQGTPLAKADIHGNILARYDYTPYGNPVTSLGNPPNGPGYTGHVNDPESGLVYMQQRYYDPVSGRFLSVDPVGPAAGDAFSFNRYAYANNNSITNIDPDGRSSTDDICMGNMRCITEGGGGGGGGGGYAEHLAQNQSNQGSTTHGSTTTGTSSSSSAASTSAQMATQLSSAAVPNDAVLYKTSNGGYYFYAPKRVNWMAVYEAGYANGPDPIGGAAAIKQGGMFDFQREDGKRLPAYVNASNYAVGVFMRGAGIPLKLTLWIGHKYSMRYSHNAGAPEQALWWTLGWEGANSGKLAQPVK